MIPAGTGLALDLRAGLPVDTNLLVLFAVGTVNRNRIETFKRAEVSNLTDLGGTERPTTSILVWSMPRSGRWPGLRSVLSLPMISTCTCG